MVTQGREHLFGTIVDCEMISNDAGRMILKWWNELPNKFPDVVLGECAVMPNHFHGIIFIERPVGADPRVSPDEKEKGGHIGPPQRESNASLFKMIQWFKTMTTNEYIRGVKGLNWKPFDGKMWQRNYYEHVIRDEKDLQQKTDYIFVNPSRWDEDEENDQNR